MRAENPSLRFAPHCALVRPRDFSAARSRAFSVTLDEIDLFAPHDRYPILLEGEIGTGKTFLARHLHNRSPRALNPFNEASLANMDVEFANSDLFGHEEGSFTGAKRKRAGLFQSTRGGTLFLDEIGKASPEIQGKLLQVLESRTINPVGADRCISVDVRIIAASNIPLETLVNQGRFLPDLHSRLNCFRITVPPLRERREDIPDLVALLVARHAPHLKYEWPPRVANSLLAALHRADWRYNVRDLEQAVTQILARARGAPLLELSHWISSCASEPVILGQRRKGRERHEILRAASEAGTISGAAEILGINRKTVRRELNRLPVEASTAVLESGPRGGRPMADRSSRSAEEEIERRTVLEILTGCKFDIALTAGAMGKHLATVYRLLLRLGISIKELRGSVETGTPRNPSLCTDRVPSPTTPALRGGA